MKETGIIMSGDHPRKILDGTKTMTRRTYGLEFVNGDPDAFEFLRMEEDLAVFRQKELTDITMLDKMPPLSSFPKKTEGSFPPHLLYIKCPYGEVGDLLWVRESFSAGTRNQEPFGIIYKADGTPLPTALERGTYSAHQGWGKWRPSIHMPRQASRIQMPISSLRPERLQLITEKDAIAEGVIKYPTRISQGKVYVALSDYSYEAYPLKWGFKKGERLKADYPSLGLARFYSLDKKDGQCIHLSLKEAFSLLEDEAMPYQDALANLWDSINAKKYPWAGNWWVWVIEWLKYSPKKD